jgi:hypothetical protein
MLMFSGKMSFYPGALAPGNMNLASPLGAPATAAAGVGGAKGAGGGGTVATRVALCEPSVLVAFYISF